MLFKEECRGVSPSTLLTRYMVQIVRDYSLRVDQTLGNRLKMGQLAISQLPIVIINFRFPRTSANMSSTLIALHVLYQTYGQEISQFISIIC